MNDQQKVAFLMAQRNFFAAQTQFLAVKQQLEQQLGGTINEQTLEVTVAKPESQPSGA